MYVSVMYPGGEADVQYLYKRGMCSISMQSSSGAPHLTNHKAARHRERADTRTDDESKVVSGRAVFYTRRP